MINESIRTGLFKYSNVPFEWGTMDCMQFVAKILGIEHSYQYSTEDEADQIMAEFGGMIGFMSHVLNQKPTFKYTIGDPVVVRIRRKLFCGINLVNSVVVKSKSGIIEIDKKYIVKGWHCG